MKFLFVVNDDIVHWCSVPFVVVVLLCVCVGVETRAFCMLSRHSTTKLHLQPWSYVLVPDFLRYHLILSS